MALTTIKQEWQDFCREVFTGNEGEIQRTEMRRAFYAGAATMLDVYVGIAQDNVSEHEAVTALENITAELAAFGVDISNGKA